MKVLYIYSGSRKGKFSGVLGKDYPDAQFYGLNHLHKFGIVAEYKEFDDLTGSKLFKKILGFRMKHFLLHFFTRRYDVVFGPSLLYMLFLKKMFRTKTKFVLLNISLTRTVAANKKNILRSHILRWLLKEVDAIVCLSTSQKEYLENSFDFLRGKVFFVPLGTDVNYYQPVYSGRKDYLLSVGRDNGRDYQTVVEAARLLPEYEFQIVCSKRNVSEISNIPKNVKVLHDLTPSELVLKYREANMLLLITHDDTHQDGSDCSGQTVLLDAMASGLPVVASRKVYLNDYVTDGKEVLFVDFYSPNDIIQKVRELQDSTFNCVLSKAARLVVEKRFSTEKMAEGLSAVFFKINDQHGGTSKNYR